MKEICIYKGIIFDDYYVTDGGRIYSIKSGTPQLIKQWYATMKDRDYKYPMVSLCKDGKVYNCKVSILVANAFMPNIGNYYNEVDHADTNPLNNNVRNLRWVTHKANCNNPSTIKNKIKAFSGKSRGTCKRKTKKVLCIEEGIAYDSLTQASEATGIRQSSISNVCNGRCHTAGGYTWKFID